MLTSVSVSFSQLDTCDYIDENNVIGGLDCAAVSDAPYTADSYQWLNCDSSFAAFPNDTLSYYQSNYSSGWIALEVTAAGCVDTSDCYFVCTWDVEELQQEQKELIMIFDNLGRKSEDKPNELIFYVYSDGTTKKVFRVE